MNQYFKCVIKIEFEAENGKVKYRREDYIVNALNPTDVEAKITEHLKGSDFEIISISVTKIIDIINYNN
jgi:hypothetical protein